MTSGFAALNKPTNSIVNSASHTSRMSTSASISESLNSPYKHIWIVTGPAGCGKSTIAAFLAKELGISYIEGDDYHTVASRQKMAQNVPLTDVDRWDWLISLRDAAVAALADHSSPTGVVVTCSALKRKYRDVIRVAAYNNPEVQVHFIYLYAPESVLLKRVAARQGHYMGAGMVHSQFECLEAPSQQETKDVIACDCSGDIVDVKRMVLFRIEAELTTDRESPRSDDGW